MKRANPIRVPWRGMSKPRVLYVLHHYPQISETYILSEIEALAGSHDITVAALGPAPYPARSPVPFKIVQGAEELPAIVEAFRPDVLHSHWLTMLPAVSDLSRETGVPFTVRTHSFDVMSAGRTVGPVAIPRQLNARFDRTARRVNDDNCLGILAFPFKRDLLERSGVAPEKITDCWPVVNYDRFHDRSPNGTGVMNLGAALPKKRMQDFLALAQRVPEHEFRLYALSYNTEELRAERDRMGSPVDIVAAVEPTEMGPEYKKHRWLVYTASFEMNSVGWPMAVAEAQAAGVGVAVPNLRPDLREYVGPGVLYDRIEDVEELVRGPVPEDMREQGFEHAKRSDVGRHSMLLVDLWSRVGAVAR